MKLSETWSATLITLAILSFVLLDPLLTAAAVELLENGDFEEGTRGWSRYGGNLSTVEEPTHSGSLAALFQTNKKTGFIYQEVEIVPGESYTLQGYAVKNDPGIERLYLRLSWQDEGGEIGHQDSPWLTEDSSSYRSLRVSATAPLKALSARVKAVVEQESPGATVIAYFDHMSFTGPAPSPAPTPTPTPTPTPEPEPTPTPTPEPEPAPSPTPTPTPTPTPEPSPSPTPTPLPAREGDAVINEVQYNSSQRGNDAPFEWLELYNRTEETIPLENWTIEDNFEKDTLPSLDLPPQGYLVVAASEEGFFTNFPDFTGLLASLEDGTIGNGLSNEGDRLILRDGTGKVIDALSYGGDETILFPPCPVVEPGHSLERLPEGRDTDAAEDFKDNAAPTPGRGLSPPPTPTLTPPPPATPTPTPPPTVTPTPTPTPPTTPTPTPTVTPAPLPTPATAPSTPLQSLLRPLLLSIAVAALAIWLWLRRRRGRP